MTWLVIGGTGQLGKALSAVLGERGVDFRAWASEDLDIRSSIRTNDLVKALRPSVIVNAAAWTDVDGAEGKRLEAFAVNAYGPKNLASVARELGSVFVHISTDYVFSGYSDSPWQESDTTGPLTVYGESKSLGEEFVKEIYPEKSFIIRTAWLYSEWGKNFAKTMTRLALLGNDEVKVVDDQVGQPTFAMDVAEQVVAAIEAQLPVGTYHATNSGNASWFDFAQEIFSLCGDHTVVERVLRTDSASIIRAAKRPTYSVLGHDAWHSIGATGNSVAPMRDWKAALHEAMPAIISAVKAEG